MWDDLIIRRHSEKFLRGSFLLYRFIIYAKCHVFNFNDVLSRSNCHNIFLQLSLLVSSHFSVASKSLFSLCSISLALEPGVVIKLSSATIPGVECCRQLGK